MRYIFISPHIDDTFLSAGGLIQDLLRQNLEVKIEYFFTISSWTNINCISGIRYIEDPDIVTEIRKTEERAVWEYTGKCYEYIFHDYLDLPLRVKSEYLDGNLVKEIRNKIFNQLSFEDIWFFPLGIDHPDHILLTNLGFELQKLGYNIVFYEDIPYVFSGEYPILDLFKRFSSLGLSPSCKTIDAIQKRKAVELYSSQVSRDWLVGIANYSYNLRDNSHIERYWSINKNLCFI